MADQSQQEVTGVSETRDQSPVYTISGLDSELRQSEIITNLIQYTRDPSAPEDLSEEEIPTIAVRHNFTIILTQDCDLLRDFESRSKEPRELNGVLLYEVEPALESRAKGIGRDIFKRIRQNKDDRYHFLESVPAELDRQRHGLPQLIIDFRKYFTLPTDEIFRQCSFSQNPAMRRCRLEMPYREHLQSRAAFYLQRVMLPLDHYYIAESTEVRQLPGPKPAAE